MDYQGVQNPASIWARVAGSAGKIPKTPIMPPGGVPDAGLGDLRPPPPKAGLNEAAKPPGGANGGPGGFSQILFDGIMGGMGPKLHPRDMLKQAVQRYAPQPAAPAKPAEPAAGPNKFDRASTLLGIGSDLLR